MNNRQDLSATRYVAMKAWCVSGVAPFLEHGTQGCDLCLSKIMVFFGVVFCMFFSIWNLEVQKSAPHYTEAAYDEIELLAEALLYGRMHKKLVMSSEPTV